MQVSQQDDFITHAVIGNQETVEMGVSDDAALMHILSSTLYTHPKLAVVREIICNGWDAHIAAGKTDTPLQITINSTQLTVRDFGFGIAHTEIGPIYGVYGNSTKRGDSKSTGGFGLGSKAPFAYTDNFEVVSHHLGQKTVYRVSKSSMEKGGKPSINKIVALPTDETGIAVSFGIQVQDHQEFLKLIREVLVLGEIQASINGEDPIATFPLSTSPTGYVVTDFRGTVGGEINVRYGNVVYPIPMRNEYQDQYTRITKDMENLWDRTTITFMAPPDSISIAPNREAIILTDGTIATIKALLDTYDYKAVVECLKAAREQCLAQLNKKVRALDDDVLLKNFTQRNSLDCIPPSCQTLVGKFATHIKQAALHVHANRIGANMSGHLVQKRMLEELIRRGLLNKPLAKAWLKAKGCESRFYTYRRLAQSLTARHLQYPLQQAMGELGDLTGIRHQIYINSGSYHLGYFCKDYLVALRERQDMNLLLAKHALIARNQKEAAEFFTNNHHTRLRSYLVVYVGANKKSDERKASVHALLTKLQYPVEEHFPARTQKVREPVTDKPQVRSKKKSGYMSLAHSHYNRRKSFLLSHAREHFTEDTLIEKPIAWTILNSKGDRDEKFERLNGETCQLILQLFGDKIAVVTAVQANKLKKQGIQNVTDFIVKYADEKLAATPDIKRFAAFAQHVSDRWDGGHKILFNMCFHEDLMKSLGLRFHISPDSAVLMKVCRNIDSSMSMFEKCKEATKHVKPHPMVETCKQKLRGSPWADYIDFDHLNRNLTAATPGSEECEIPYTIVRHLLK